MRGMPSPCARAWLLLALLGLARGLRRSSEDSHEDSDSAKACFHKASEEDLAKWPTMAPIRNLVMHEEPPVEEDGAMHVASVACRAGCHYLVALIRTFAAQAMLEGGKKPYFHAFTETTLCFGYVRFFVQSEPQILEAINLRTWDVYAIAGLPVNATKHGKSCTMVRLFMPRLFPRLSRLIYLDMDTVVLNSLKPLWNLPVPVLSMGENDEQWHGGIYNNCPTWRNGTVLALKSPTPGARDTCYIGPYGLNAGVLVANLTGWREHGVDRDIDYWSGLFVSGEIDMKMNDQDILNLIVQRHTDYHAPLPCEANLLHTNRWMCLFTEGANWEAWNHRNWTETLKRNGRQPIVVHDKFGRRTYVQSWRWFYNQTIYYSKLVVTGRLGNASSLCDAFHCGGPLVMEESYSCHCRVGVKGVPCSCTLRDYAVEDGKYQHAYPAGK